MLGSKETILKVWFNRLNDMADRPESAPRLRACLREVHMPEQTEIFLVRLSRAQAAL